MESFKTKKKRKRDTKQVTEKGIDNDSFELNETAPSNEQKDTEKKDSKPGTKLDARKEQSRNRKTSRTKKVVQADTVAKSDTLSQSVRATESASDPPCLTGITIHRADQLRVDPHISHLIVRVHVMDESRGSYHERSRSDTDEGNSTGIVQPVSTKPVRVGSGQFLLPIWEQMLVIDDDYGTIVQNKSSLLLFEILNSSSPSPSDDQELELLAWAFLRPLGANGHVNAGPRRQRLQLFEPVLSGSMRSTSACCRPSSRGCPTTANLNRAAGSDPALRAGSELLACWAAGPSHRIRYPSTLYVSLKKLDLDEHVQKQALTSRSPRTGEKDEADPNEEIACPSLAEYKRLTRLERSLIQTTWKRESDQPCRVPNELIGCGTRWNDDPGLCTLTWPTIRSNLSVVSRGAQCVRFSPNGHWLAVGSLGSALGARTIETGLSESDKPSLDCAVWLYRYPLKTLTSAPQIQLAGHTRTVYAIEWAPTPLSSEPTTSSINAPTATTNRTGSTAIAWPLASASGDGTVRLWWIAPSLLNESARQTGPEQQRFDRQTVVSLLDRSASDQLGCGGGEQHRAEMTTHKGVLCTVLGHPGFVYSLAFRPVTSALVSESSSPLEDVLVPQTEHMLATGCYDQSVRLWIVRPRRVELLVELSVGHRAHVNSVTFSRDGQRLYSADAKGTLAVWNRNNKNAAKATGESRTRRQSTPGVTGWSLEKRITNEELSDCIINHVEVHPKQPLLLVHTRDSIPKMIDLRSGFIAVRFHGSLNHRELIRSCISPCGTFVFSGSEDHNLYVWNAITGDQVACYRHLGLRSTITAISYHPVDNVFAFTVQDGDAAPVRVYAYDPKATTLEATVPEVKVIGDHMGKRFNADKKHLEHMRSENQRRKRERIRKAFAKLDSVLNTELQPNETSENLDELEWRPTFTAIDEPRRDRSAVRGRPDGEAKSITNDVVDKSKTVRARSESRDQQSHLAVAIYDYRAERSDELTVRRGDQLQLLYRDSPKWWMARALNNGGQEGFVPVNYIAYDENATRTLTRKDATPTPTPVPRNVPAQRTKLSAQQVSHMLNKPYDKPVGPNPKIFVEDVEDVEQNGDSIERIGSSGSSLRSPVRSGPPSPTNLITLTPIRSKPAVTSATTRRGSRPLPDGGNLTPDEGGTRQLQRATKSPDNSEPDSHESGQNASMRTNTSARLSRISELSKVQQTKRSSRPLPPLD